MSPLAVGPILALLGVVAAFYVLRGKARSRKSMYRTLREQRERDLKKSRERANAAKAAAEKAEIDREAAEQAAAEQAAAAAAAPPVGPSSTATIAPPAEQAPKSEWESTPAQTPAYTPPPPKEPEAPAPEPVAAAPEPATAEPVPVPPPATGEAGKASWEIVQPTKEEAEEASASTPAAAATSGKAGWELDTAERQRIDERHKGKGKGRDAEDEEGDGEGETLAQKILSYAGLIAALLVILLGILFMIGSKTSS